MDRVEVELFAFSHSGETYANSLRELCIGYMVRLKKIISDKSFEGSLDRAEIENLINCMHCKVLTVKLPYTGHAHQGTLQPQPHPWAPSSDRTGSPASPSPYPDPGSEPRICGI